MTKTQKITISGGFHNVGEIDIIAKTDPRGRLNLSEGQAHRIGVHMCGVKGCICGIHHGWMVEGVTSGDLGEAMLDASAGSYPSSSRNR